MKKTQENNANVKNNINGDRNGKRVVKYKLLEMELIRTGITKRELADRIGMRYDTLCSKMRGKIPFLGGEAVLIKRALESHYRLEELFSADV